MNASFNTGTGGLNPENKFDAVLYKQSQNVFTNKKDRYPKVFVLNLHFYFKSGLSLYSGKEFIDGNLALIIRITFLNLLPL